MNYAPANMTQVLGLGSYVGELREGPDGNLYEWVEGVDGLGNPIGFWKKAFKAVKSVAGKVVQAGLARLIPGPIKKLARVACTNVNHLGPVATAVPAITPYYVGAKGLCKVLRRTGIAEAPAAAMLPPAARTAAKSVCGVINKLAPVLRWVPVAGGYFKKAQGMCTKLRSAGIAGMDGPIMEAPDGQLYEVVDTVGESGQPRRQFRRIRLVIPAYIGPPRQGARPQQRPARRMRRVRTRPAPAVQQTSAAVNGYDGYY